MTNRRYSRPSNSEWIRQESDGTWTVHLVPYHPQAIIGLPTRELASHIEEQMLEAMDEYHIAVSG